MTKLEDIQNNLAVVFESWNKLNDDQKRQKINFILPFVQLASYLGALGELGLIPESDALLKYKESFRQDYEKLFGQDLSQMKKSDLSPDLFLAITNVQEDQASLSEEQRADILSYKQKYVHAHSRAMFNYGDFLKDIYDKQLAGEDHAQERAKIITAAANVNSQVGEIVSTLFDLNESFGLEKRSADLGKDDLENHALLNQMSNYLQNFFLFELLTDQKETAQIVQVLEEEQPLKSTIKREHATGEIPSNFDKLLEEKGLSMEVGIESESLLNTLRSSAIVEGPIQRNVELKKTLADLNSRRKMQTKYGLEPSIPAIPDVTKFFEDFKVTSTGAEGMVISTKDFLAITKHLNENLAGLGYEQGNILRNVANFTEAEAFFFNLLFLNGDFPKTAKIEVDGVYDYTKSPEENLKNVWGLIQRGRFHEHLLDMIQAHEIAFGPHNFSDAIRVKSEVVKTMKLQANLSDLSLDDANVQINLSLWVDVGHGEKKNAFLPEIVGSNGDTKIYFNQLGLEFLKIMETVVAEASGEIGGIARHQHQIGAAFDFKKHIGGKLAGTPFLNIDPNEPAFLNHKRLAAKNVTLRVSAINDKVAVAEIRLIGNNPHFAKFAGSEDVFRSGLDFIPEILLPRISEKIQEFIASKSKEELAALYDKKVEITSNGKIAGLESVEIVHGKSDNIFDPEQKATIDLREPANSVSLVRYQSPLAAHQTQIGTVI